MDPKFKLKAIKDTQRIEDLQKIMKRKITNEINNKTRQPTNSEQVPPVPSTSAANSVPSQIFGCDIPTYSLWCEFDSEANKEFEPKPSDVQAPEELKKYLADN